MANSLFHSLFLGFIFNSCLRKRSFVLQKSCITNFKFLSSTTRRKNHEIKRKSCWRKKALYTPFHSRLFLGALSFFWVPFFSIQICFWFAFWRSRVQQCLFFFFLNWGGKKGRERNTRLLPPYLPRIMWHSWNNRMELWFGVIWVWRGSSSV